MNHYLILPIVQTVFSLVLAAIVLKGHFRSFVHRLFSIDLLVLATWGLIIFGMRASPDIEHAYSWDRWLIPLAPLMSVLLYHFSVRYTFTKIKSWVIPSLYASWLVFIPLAATDLVFSGMQLKSYGYAPILGPVAPFFLLYSSAIVIMALVTFTRGYKRAFSAEHRNRIAYIITGVSVSLVGGAFDLLPILGLPLYPGAIIGNLIFCTLTTVAIIRHKLLDIRIVLRKTIVYVLTSALVAIPLVGVYLIFAPLVEGTAVFPIWGRLLILIAVALILPLLWRWVQKHVDSWFYRDRYDYLKALETFGQDPQSLTDSAQLGSTMVNLITKALRSSSAYLLQPLPQSDDFAVACSSGVNSSTADIVLKGRSPLIRFLEQNGDMLAYQDLDYIPQLQSVLYKEKKELERIGAEFIVPMRTHIGSLSGLLILGAKRSGQPYTIEDKELINTICHQMSTNLENARLYEASQREVAERKRAEEKLRQSHEQLRNLSAHIESMRETERTSIAREVHDELGQALTAIKMDLSWLNKRLPEEQEVIIKKTREMLRLIDTTIQTVKRISTDLRPGILDDLGLVAAMEWQVQEFQERTSIKCALTADGENMNLDRKLATAVFRILQEALTNVARHADAARVTVSLKRRDGQLVLQVIDNGKGITEKQIANPRSFGLIGMRERARSWNGSVKINGISDKGTTVTVSIPLKRKEESDDKNISR